MDDKVKGQVNLYVYDPEKLKNRVSKVADQLCKKIDYPLHVRKISDSGESNAWKELFPGYVSFSDISSADGEGNCDISPVYSVILVSYNSLLSPHTPECFWHKWFSAPKPQEVYLLDEKRVQKLSNECRTIQKKSVSFPPIILSDFSGTKTERQKLEETLCRCEVPDNWTIYLDRNDENKNLESLEFNIDYFIQTFWRINIHRRKR